MVGVRRVVANVFLMPTLQVGNPVAVHVHVKTDDLLRRARVSRIQGLHGSIVRPLLRNAREFLVTAAALTCKSREMLHFGRKSDRKSGIVGKG